MKITKDALFNVIASMHKQSISKSDRDVIGPTSNIFPLNFDLGPSTIKGIFKASVDDEVGLFLFKHSRFIAIKLLGWIGFHEFKSFNIKINILEIIIESRPQAICFRGWGWRWGCGGSDLIGGTGWI